MAARLAPTAALTAALLLVAASPALAAESSGSTQARPAAAPTVVSGSSLWTALDDVTRAEFERVTSKQSTEPGLPDGRVVPLDTYRVGPLFGAVGGPHTGGVHSGLDLGADAGEPVRAIEGGRVVVAGWQGAAGKAVTIRTADGHLVLYAHLNSMSVSRGDRVETGERIGRVGSTGNSTGPHLHLGVTKPNGSQMDPLTWMDVTAGELRRLSD